MPEFLLPDLGEGLQEAEVIAWCVQVGDHVTTDQIVAEVETAKAVVEVPIPFAGTVAALHAEPGMTVAVGAPLISVTVDVARFRPRDTAEAVSGGAAEADEASGNVLIGYGTGPTSRRARATRRRPGPGVPVRTGPHTQAGAVVAAGSASPPGPTAAVARDLTGPVRVISPLVRKLARNAGLDLTSIVGSGPDGLVLRRDVDQAIAALRKSATLSAPKPLAPDADAETGPAAAHVAGQHPAAPAREVRIPIRGIRKAVADNRTRSRREIPEATVWVDADATNLLAARAALNARAPDAPVSMLALLARFALAGLRRYPELNAHIDNDEIVVPSYVHLGFAAQTEQGLVVPVIRNAHLMSARELAAALGQQIAAARAGRLAPADLTGGTMTVNNYGVYGVDGSAAIINYPEVAILGMGRIIDRPWAVDGQVVVRKVTELTLAFDHRVCDGGTAGGFLRYIADCLESPVLALADL